LSEYLAIPFFTIQPFQHPTWGIFRSFDGTHGTKALTLRFQIIGFYLEKHHRYKAKAMLLKVNPIDIKFSGTNGFHPDAW
jgi:hypothetical protein